MIRKRSYFISHFSRLGIVKLCFSLLSAYRKGSNFIRRFSRLGIAQASLALLSACRKGLTGFGLPAMLAAFTFSAMTAHGATQPQNGRQSFAIVVDSDSYRHCETDIEAYRDAVCEEGLDAFILQKKWSSPDEIRDTLVHFYKHRHLEGAVFVGDIPVPMIRQAQHLASAFKMDEKKYPMRDSSIPSDRFYDDFDLKFNFVDRDSLETSLFYYNLASDCPQHIDCDIYSGRIKPSDKFRDKYEELSAYLKKLVRIKKENNPVDRICSYTGDGSFSNSLIAWKDECLTLAGQFPDLGSDAASARYYAFAMYPDMKSIMLNEIARNDLDIVLFHEHGMPERQYLTSVPDRSDPYRGYLGDGYELGRYFARESYRRSVSRGKSKSETAASLCERYGIDSTWFCDAFAPEVMKADSLRDLESGIVLDDIQKTAPNARMVLFDACYNGDFRENDCVASRYVMAGGNTVAAIGNSTNVLQDKSSTDLMGMLAAGYSVGEWMMNIHNIESHILGDPTFRFASSYDFERPDLHSRDCAYWLKYSSADWPADIRGLALHKLHALRYKGLAPLLEEIYSSSDNYMLRLQCVTLMAHYEGDRYENMLKKAMDDPYEFIRRKAAYFSGKVGSPDLVRPLAQMYLKDYNSLRVAFNIASAGSMFQDEAFLNEVENQVSSSSFIFDKNKFLDEVRTVCRIHGGMAEGAKKALNDTGGKSSMRELYISSMRNIPYAYLAGDCIKLIRDEAESEEMRVKVAEVLGWFVYARNRAEIVDALSSYLEKDMPDRLRNEIVKTVARLSDYLRESPVQAVEENTFIPCSRKAESSFAIITDNLTWSRCRTELLEYRDVLEKEGLGTYILARNWDDPMQLRQDIIELYGKKPRLEGIVLVGDVPVVMVRQGQHLTSAFKMDETRFEPFVSSVASDRFYDDFSLEFEYISKDADHEGVYYYRLSEKGAQELHPDIYSARMKVPGAMTGDKYGILSEYLKKVVAAHKEHNSLDNMTFFAGTGYNSDCLTIWRQKPLLFREIFPYCFSRSSDNRFLNFREQEFMEDRLFNEIQRENLDYFQFSEHGDFDTQYISPGAGGAIKSTGDAVERIIRWAAPAYSKLKDDAEREEFMHEVMDSVFHLSRTLLSDSLIVKQQKLSETEERRMNITLDELAKLRSNARMVVFNACYNGSFHNPEGYVAGFHVFGPGRCVVAQANTVNVLQDKWEDKMLGIVSMGERVGMWQKEIHYLESHLIGDPTFRFTPHSSAEAAAVKKLHSDLLYKTSDVKTWNKYLQSDSPVLRATGITQLSYTDASKAEPAALGLLFNDSSMVVRLHALNALAAMKSGHLNEALQYAMTDPCEVIVRSACHIAAKTCDSCFVSGLEALMENEADMLRVTDRAAPNALKVTDGSEFSDYVRRAGDRSLSDAKRRSAIRMFRNSNVLEAIPVLLGIVSSPEENTALRKDACEALGWYDSSCKRAEISAELEKLLKLPALPEELRSEVAKTLKRL